MSRLSIPGILAIALSLAACDSADDPGAPATEIPPISTMQQVTLDATAHAQKWSDCPSGYSCYWDYPNAEGPRWIAPSPGWFYLGNFRDRIASVYNRGGGAIDFYNCWDPQCTGADYMTTVYVGQSRNLDYWEDKADIIYIHP